MENKIEEQDLKKRLDHVFWSIFLYNESLTELFYLSEVRYNNDEIAIVNSHPFDFYRVTLQYCFVTEYNKLFEAGRQDSKQHISSLFQLNQTIKASKLGSSYDFVENECILGAIKKSDFYLKMRLLRDKKFIHSDTHDINLAFSVAGFNKADFDCGFDQLNLIKSFILNCTKLFQFEYFIEIPNRDQRTYNFIKNHAEYKKYFYNHFLDAIKDRPSNYRGNT